MCLDVYFLGGASIGALLGSLAKLRIGSKSLPGKTLALGSDRSSQQSQFSSM